MNELQDTVYVLDTNVILTDRDVLERYADKDVVLPDTVLAEVDKVKLGRADAETRFNGREFTRRLFEISEGRPLTDKLSIPGHLGSLHVNVYDNRYPAPDGLSPKNPDDRIVTCAVRLRDQMLEEGLSPHVVLVTSDLNMLLKAQNYGIDIERHEHDVTNSFAKRFIVRPFQKYRTPLTILSIAVALFAATIVIAVNSNTNAVSTQTVSNMPSEYRNFVSEDQATTIDALQRLQVDPNDSTALETVGLAYLHLYDATYTADPGTAVTYAKHGQEYYGRALVTDSLNLEARTNYGILCFYMGDIDSAIDELTNVLDRDTNNVMANYYLGVVLSRGRSDYEAATAQFEKVIDLASDTEELSDVSDEAKNQIMQIQTLTQNLDKSQTDSINA